MHSIWSCMGSYGALRMKGLSLLIFSLLLVACSTAGNIEKSSIQPLRISNSTLAKKIQETGSLSRPVAPANEFDPDDREVISHLEFIHLTGDHKIRWAWYTPQGELYQDTGDYPLTTREGRYVSQGAAYHSIPLKDAKAAELPGNWQVKIFLDDKLTLTENFFVHSLKDGTLEGRIADVDFGNYYALVIGIDNYKTLKKLTSANRDAQEVAKVLTKKYNFNVTLLLDAARADIIRALDQIRLNLTQQDNLLIYYAGHGILDEAADEGYWLPADASGDSTLNWISNAHITATIKAMTAKHVMVVADSCYSGKLIRSVQSPFQQKLDKKRKKSYYQAIADRRTRTVMCSGGLEPVLDGDGKREHSVFAAAFIQALNSGESVMEGAQLFARLRHPVMLDADQTPEYSDIRKAGHDGGDFLFVPFHLIKKEK